MTQQVIIKRVEMQVPTIDAPERRVYQIEYRAGELPPRFLYIPVKEWTKELEAEKIRADIQRRIETPEETIEV